MDISKLSRKEEKEKECIKVTTAHDSNVRMYNETIFFNLMLNGVQINGCTVARNKDGDNFISFPSEKGKNGKWYKIVYAVLSEEDQDNILMEIQKGL